ncbi:phenylacetate--CoA ligase family protein [Sphingobium sp. Cam5-1]|uniref:phenylacetate--CoA ligase family protein n=1 Tax=Sphingobium sp. Cam5-1 TaxID=2789327 RepID=UPI0018AD0F08|nr:phenylacetate--CoA ligase family protein [Sphingobium sp. Cam5-1]QPI75399.1 phenylacetate--CoA ligase family protein [Sphingobium sp. Cam5-1]
MGWAVAQLPFSCRPGIAGVYNRRQRDVISVVQLSALERQRFVFSKVQSIACWAYNNVPFYADLYLSEGVDPTKFRHFEDISSLPLVTKQALQKVPIEYRSAKLPKKSLENTGGSSGQPLSFYIEPDSIPHEWAHMHSIWRQVGYRSSDLKIVFAGRSSIRNVLDYDSVRHHYAADIYAGWAAVADKILALPSVLLPRFLHGYPSAIFDFVHWLDAHGHPLLPVLRGRIRGLMLGSEYPVPEARARTERLLGCASVSWYGHTERSILAREIDEKSVYHPFPSYGFVEAIGSDIGHRLIGTSYYNRASPFIRYDTGDLVEAESVDGIVESFRVVKGRSGDFIIDKDGNKVFLTGLIFGRHHKIFDHSRFIQVRQISPGSASILIVPRGQGVEDWRSLFDGSNLKIDLDFCELPEPVRTTSGKVPLLIKE